MALAQHGIILATVIKKGTRRLEFSSVCMLKMMKLQVKQYQHLQLHKHVRQRIPDALALGLSAANHLLAVCILQQCTSSVTPL